MHDHGDLLDFDPRLPESWPSLTFRLTRRATRVRVTVRTKQIEFMIEDGPDLTVKVRGKRHDVTTGGGVTVALRGQGPQILGEPDPKAFHGKLRADGTVITASCPRCLTDNARQDVES